MFLTCSYKDFFVFFNAVPTLVFVQSQAKIFSSNTSSKHSSTFYIHNYFAMRVLHFEITVYIGTRFFNMQPSRWYAFYEQRN